MIYFFELSFLQSKMDRKAKTIIQIMMIKLNVTGYHGFFQKRRVYNMVSKICAEDQLDYNNSIIEIYKPDTIIICSLNDAERKLN